MLRRGTGYCRKIERVCEPKWPALVVQVLLQALGSPDMQATPQKKMLEQSIGKVRLEMRLNADIQSSMELQLRPTMLKAVQFL
jgi:hypothetical protein